MFKQIRFKELLMLLLVLTVVGVSHGYNMFHYPFYENDEGIYTSRAWSVLTQGELDLYTYWYDHAPAGWLVMSGWAAVSGGFDSFGMAVNSGRVLMLVIHIASAVCLYWITRQLSGSKLAAIGAVLLFSLSPLGIYFQRRVLLDNIMILWLLVSLALLLKKKVHLTHVLWSALVFGLAVLTKESAIFFAPVLAYAAYRATNAEQRRFAVVLWVLISMSVVSWYLVLAILKGELWPAANGEHVSLITTYVYHLGRGEGLPFWQSNSDFTVNFIDWWKRDAVMMTLGVGTTILGLILSWRMPKLRVPTGLLVVYWLFLMRGGLIIHFYILPLIPLIAISTAMIVSLVGKRWISSPIVAKTSIMALMVLAVVYMQVPSLGEQWRRDDTSAQLRALEWLQQNAEAEDKIVVDDTLLVDLRQFGEPGHGLPDAHSAWKVEKDYAVSEELLRGDWRNLDYIVLSYEMLKQSERGEFKLIPEALAYADLVEEWKENDVAYWMSVYEVGDRDDLAYRSLWNSWRDQFKHNYGQIVNPRTGQTTSSGQAMAMWLAVEQEEQAEFDGAWTWMRDRMQWRNEDKLLSWLWQNEAVADSATSAKADQDAAMALILAHQKWGNDWYLAAAREIITDIWQQEVKEINGRYWIVAGGGWTQHYGGQLVSPGYWSPAYYRIFAEIDRQHPWEELAEDVYDNLVAVQQMPENRVKLVPNWLLVNEMTGELESASRVRGEMADQMGEQASWTFWQLALDAKWHNSPRAIDWLTLATSSWRQLWGNNQPIATSYSLDGTAIDAKGSRLNTASVMAAWSVVDEEMARKIYVERLRPELMVYEPNWSGEFNPEKYGQLTLATALYHGRLNLK